MFGLTQEERNLLVFTEQMITTGEELADDKRRIYSEERILGMKEAFSYIRAGLKNYEAQKNMLGAVLK